MQFFLLLLFNIFMGAVLYLIISLKLERSATEFRQRRLRKEMDQIIQEFNATAERNISILESRIALLKKIMARSGDMKSVDFIIDDPAIETRTGRAAAEPPDTARAREQIPSAKIKNDGDVNFEHNGGSLIKKGLLLIFEKVFNKLPGTGRGYADNYPSEEDVEVERPVSASAEPESRIAPPAGSPALIEKDFSAMLSGAASPEKTERPLTEDEISEIITSAEDKYSMVAVLFERGCGIEEISRYSGIPAGEVRLVLNLNSSR